MIEGLVTTVIPVHNRPAMLREAVESVLNQTWRQIEIVIVNDGSTDDTPSVAADLQCRHPETIRVLRQDNAGPGPARQRGLEAARGEFVQFLDSDDLLLPDKCAIQVAGLRSDPDADIAYAKAYVSENGIRLSTPGQRTGERFRTLFPALLREPIWPTMTPLYRYTALLRVGPWPRKRQLEDWEYDAQAAALGLKLHYDEVFVAETRNHTDTRLCHEWRHDDEALREVASAHMAVCAHACRAGIPYESPEMCRFARSLFTMARVTSARGLSSDAKQLLSLARTIAVSDRWQLRAFQLASTILGWQHASVWAERVAGRPR